MLLLSFLSLDELCDANASLEFRPTVRPEHIDNFLDILSRILAHDKQSVWRVYNDYVLNTDDCNEPIR